MDTQTNGRIILVTGATGTQGGAVARHLLERGFAVRALTRDPAKPAARALAAQGIEVLRGDYDDRASLDRALAGAHGVFSVQNVVEVGDEGEARQGVALADAALAAGVRHLVQASAGGVGPDNRVGGLQGKRRVEEHLRAIGISHTILRPTWFMSNWAWPLPFFGPAIEAGELVQPLDPATKLQQISPDDIGAFAALAFAAPERWAGRTIELAGDERTIAEIAETLAAAHGRPVRYRQVSWEEWREMAGPFFEGLYRWFAEAGYTADIAALRRERPELADFPTYLRRAMEAQSVAA